jgi:hypothetical protein
MIDLAARLGLCAPRSPGDLIDARMVILSEHTEALLAERSDDAASAQQSSTSEIAGMDLGALLHMPLSMLAVVVDDVAELCERELIPLSPVDQAGYGGLWRSCVKWQEEKSALVFDVPVQQIVSLRAARALRQALVAAAASGSPKFFLGTDSAPHGRSTKEAACGCAGCYTAHAGIELYAEAFEAAGALDKLEGFASHFGADFYVLPRNAERITLVRNPWPVAAKLAYLDDDVLVPFRAGESVAWGLA